MKYKQINEITQEEFQCGIGSCPAIYQGIREVTPQFMRCAACACNRIYSAEKQEKFYLVIGKVINPSEAGLEGRVGQGEALIEVPIKLIDNKGK